MYPTVPSARSSTPPGRASSMVRRFSGLTCGVNGAFQAFTPQQQTRAGGRVSCHGWLGSPSSTGSPPERPSLSPAGAFQGMLRRDPEGCRRVWAGSPTCGPCLMLARPVPGLSDPAAFRRLSAEPKYDGSSLTARLSSRNGLRSPSPGVPYGAPQRDFSPDGSYGT